MRQKLIFGKVNGFNVLLSGDCVSVSFKDKTLVKSRHVENLAKFLEKAKQLKLGWAKTADFNIIYIYDKKDDNFGYAVNLEAQDLSEWGYAPFNRESYTERG